MESNDDGSQRLRYTSLSKLVKPALRAMKYDNGQENREETDEDKRSLAL